MKRFHALVLLGLIGVGGCISDRPFNPAATRPATDIDPATTQPSYWLDRPDTSQVADGDFYRLWNACEAVARDYLFTIDRRDYRRGLLTTEPMVSKQIFEPWRHDAGTAADTAESTLVPIRRTLFFQIDRDPDGTFVMHPKVLVERQTVVEPKLRAVTTYPRRYWYPIRRDAAMEEAVAKAVEKKMGR